MTRALKLMAALFVGLAWANDTDAEILKDLDFFSNYEIFQDEMDFESLKEEKIEVEKGEEKK